MGEIRKILIVEDEILSAIWMTDFLAEEGYFVCEPVTTGEQALNAVQSENPDLIFMDIHLAGSMDGIEAAAIIHESYHIPIVFMTGYSNSDIYDRVKTVSPLACLDKPIQVSDLELILERVKKLA